MVSPAAFGEVSALFKERNMQVAIHSKNKRLRGARMQVWGDIKQGQSYQHAVCYIPGWNIIVDLSIARQFLPLEYRGYETHPEEVRTAKEFVRQLIRRTLQLVCIGGNRWYHKLRSGV